MSTATVASVSRFDHATRDLDPPLALVDLAAFRHNAADLARRAAGKPVRLVTKSVRCVELIRLALAMPGFSGLMCFSLAEALWLHRQGISSDIVVAYPTADRAALRELAANPAAAAAIALTVDSTDQLDLIDEAVGESRRPQLRLSLDLDASWRPFGGIHIGMRRSPVHSVSEARALATEILSRDGFRLAGLMAYEGQIAGVADAPAGRPLAAAGVGWIQRRSAAELARRRAEVAAELKAVTALEFVNGGGTGSIESTTVEGAITEVAAGSGLTGPTLFDQYRAFSPSPALFFALPVVRRPGAGIVTVFGGGYVASGPASRDRLPRPHLPAGLRTSALEGVGEVQTPVFGSPADELRLGDRVWFRHAKAGELAERFSHYHLVEDDQVVGTVPTYRGEGTSFG